MIESIHDKALRVAREFKKSEADLISVIQEIDFKKAFYEKKFTSTYDYCVKFLNLSDNVSLDFITVARKSRAVPELKEALKNEVLTLSKARRISSVITKDNSKHWIKLARSVSKAHLEKEIARVNPKALTLEKAKYITSDRLKLELGVSEEFMKDLKRVQEILTQKDKAHVGFEKALGCVLKDFLKREDPLEKAKRSKMQLGPGRQRQTVPTKRVPLPSSLKHQLNLRDEAQCTYRNLKGERCEERKWLHFHHIREVAKGGTNITDNLVTLCSGHHRLAHYRGADVLPVREDSLYSLGRIQRKPTAADTCVGLA